MADVQEFSPNVENTLQNSNVHVMESEEMSHENGGEDGSMESQSSLLADPNSKISYSHASQYWSKVPPTVNGMLGGFSKISPTDICGSENFLKWIFSRKIKPGRTRCIDCGAGIGRITQLLLQRFFGVVDMIEQSSEFTQVAKQKFANNPKIGRIICSGLQDFFPEDNMYDVVWIQWVLIYLPDKDLVEFLKRMSRSLKPNGVICIKENVTSGDGNDPNEVILDEEDLSVTRPLQLYIKLANEAGLDLIRCVQQQKFPKQIYKVYMLAFKPDKYSTVNE